MLCYPPPEGGWVQATPRPQLKSSERSFQGPFQESGVGERQHYHLTHVSSLQAGAGSSEKWYCTASQWQDQSGGLLGTRALPAWRAGDSAEGPTAKEGHCPHKGS